MYKLKLLSSVAHFAPENEGGVSEAQRQRDAIKVETIKKGGEVEKKEEETNNNDEGGDGDSEEGEEDGQDEGNDSEDESGEETKEKELSVEDYKKEIDRLNKVKARLERRQGKTARERDEIKNQLKLANDALAAKVEEGKGLSPEDVERLAEEKAEGKAAEREFNKAVQSLNRAATKADKEFPANIKEVTETIAPVPGAMIGILEDLDNENGGEVLAYLAANEDEYEAIYELPPLRMAKQLDKISEKLVEAKKKPVKKISKAPAPVDSIKGGSKSPSILPTKPTENMDEFVRMRQQQVADRRKAKYG